MVHLILVTKLYETIITSTLDAPYFIDCQIMYMDSGFDYIWIVKWFKYIYRCGYTCALKGWTLSLTAPPHSIHNGQPKLRDMNHWGLHNHRSGGHKCDVVSPKGLLTSKRDYLHRVENFFRGMASLTLLQRATRPTMRILRIKLAQQASSRCMMDHFQVAI